MTAANPKFIRPAFASVPFADGLRWRAGAAFRFEEKLDGRWHERAIGASIVVGELMRDGRFYAFDVPIFEGQDVRGLALRERLPLLDTFNLKRPATGAGGAFLGDVVARGGEGIVAKDLDAPYGGGWTKCKRIETFDLRVVEIHGERQSVRLADGAGDDYGWCPVRSPKLDRLCVGDTVEIAAQCRHASGKLREPRFVRARPDRV